MKAKNHTLLLVDLIGAIIVSAILAGAGWFAYADPESSSHRVNLLATELDQSSASLQRIQVALNEQVNEQRILQEQTASLGQLPRKSPIDQDLKTIANLAASHNVNVIEVAPVFDVRYPSVLELCYSIKTEATFSDYLRFLRAFQNCSFWSDLTYLRIDQPTNVVGDSEFKPRAELTVSFYSAYH
jgi:Tfp pilus assembly protein PilO